MDKKNNKYDKFFKFCFVIGVVFIMNKYFNMSKSESIILICYACSFLIVPIAKKIFFWIWKKYKRIRRLNKDDFNRNIDYYRDLLKKSNPLILGIIDSFKLDTNVFVAELLYLEYINAITIKEGKIERNTEFYGPLLTSDKFLLSKIENGTIKIKDKDMFLTMMGLRIKDDAMRKIWNGNALIVEAEYKSFDVKRFLEISIIFYLLFAFLIVLKAYVAVFIIIIFSKIGAEIIESIGDTKSMYDITNYKRTKEGIALNKKLEGLKRFLKDYSLLEEKDKEHLILWNEYLIYSVLFGQNKIVVKEYEKYIQFMKESENIVE